MPLPVLDDSWQDVDLLGGGADFANGLQVDTFGAPGLELVHPLHKETYFDAVATWSPMHRQAGAFYATPHLELNMPLFSEYTTIKGRRGLLDHFSNVLSHLIVLREDEGNPFQQLVLPMSRQSPAVASAIYALSSAHLEFRGVAGVEQKSILFHSEAARNLANLIEKGAEGNQNELLAAVILLIYYEVIVHGHLKGAVAILNSGPATSDPTRAFLERAFRFYDVIAALSFRTPTLSEAPPTGCIDHFLPVDSRGASRPAGSADALLGMATSLWPVVHQLSNLGALKDEVVKAETEGEAEKAEELRSKMETAASAIEASLVAWEPELSPDQASSAADRSGPLWGILNNARAYQHSSLVHLYRSIHGERREHPTVQQHARASLQFCIGTVESAGPMGALLWPLFVAACEAHTEEDRALATQSFQGIDKHQGMANIEQSWRIVQEVWRRADGARAEDDDMAALEIELENSGLDGVRGSKFREEDLWRQVCRDMGLAVVFG
ncbi:hypothetical protein PWT90_07575 [Aphanocladium album]|nr:hypothetical protein PWT90_07575 [Aphanocladium album]